MLNINLLKRFENKTFVISFIGALIVFLKLCNLDFIADLIPKNYADIITAGFGLLAMLGIIIDPTTSGISDQTASGADVAQDSTENQIQADSNSTNDNVADSSNSNDSIESDVKNAIVVNSTITPKANTADDTTNANA